MKLLKASYIRYFFYTIVSLVACVFVLIVAKQLLAPLALAVLISIALLPVLNWTQKLIPSKLLSISLLLMCFTLVIIGLVAILIVQFTNFYQDLPDISQKLSELIILIEQYIKNTFNVTHLNITKVTQQISNQTIKMGSTEGISSIFGEISGFLTYVIIIPIYVFLFLYYSSGIKYIVKQILETFKIKSFAVIDQVSLLIQSYLKGILIVMLLLGLVNSVGLFILEVPYAFFLGFMVAIFAIIPYIGSLIGSLIVLFVSYFSQGSVETLLYIIVLFSTVQFLEGNFLTPKIVGEKVNLNPLIAILSLLIGGQIWGIVGMILALPVASILLMISKHFKTNAFQHSIKS